LGAEIEENDIGGACGRYGGEEKCIRGCGGRKLKERKYLENLGVDMRVILKQM
jgi:hypothetical protein